MMMRAMLENASVGAIRQNPRISGARPARQSQRLCEANADAGPKVLHVGAASEGPLSWLPVSACGCLGTQCRSNDQPARASRATRRVSGSDRA
jgi:hypothetical protein